MTAGKATSFRGLALLAISLLAAGTFLLVHAGAVWRGIEAYNNLDRAHLQKLKGVPVTVPPSRSLFLDIDPLLWNHYALQVGEGRVARVRWTSIDNVPGGRAVHWSNGLIWLLAGAGSLRRLFTGEDLRTAIDRASLGVNPLFLAALLLASAVILLRRLGWQAALIVVIAIGGSRQFVNAFSPGGPDHHGLVLTAAFWTLLGIILGGAGWTQDGARSGDPFPESATARRWFLFSAFSAAAGLWISAVVQIFLFFSVGCGFLLLLAVGRPSSEAGLSYRPELWRLWGRWGAVASLAFYLIEYFPGDMGWRLEVNHPLYAAAWWGASELMALIAGRRFRTAGAAAEALPGGKTALAAAALAAPPLLMLWRGAEVCVPLDPFIRRLHEFIVEFQPIDLKTYVRGLGLLSLTALVAAARAVAICRRREDSSLAAFAIGCTLLSVALAFWQTRWSAIAAQALVVMTVAGLMPRPKTPAWPSRRGTLAAVLAIVLCVQFAWTAATTLARDRDFQNLRQLDVALASFLVVRDVADVLRAEHGGGGTVVLSSGWPSTILASAAGFGVVPSLYWENHAGLAAAADIFLARTDEEARRLLHARGIAYIVVFIEPFFPKDLYYAKYGSVDPRDISRTLGERIVTGRAPNWLIPFPYSPLIPMLKNSPRFSVLVFRVAPDA